MNEKDIRKNASGCWDPTPYSVIKKMDKEEERFNKMLHTIFYICNLAGFRVDGRITFIDERTGRIWD